MHYASPPLTTSSPQALAHLPTKQAGRAENWQDEGCEADEDELAAVEAALKASLATRSHPALRLTALCVAAVGPQVGLGCA